MSAYGYKQTSRGLGQNVRFTPERGHKWLWCGMSAFDPKRTLAQFGDHTRFTSHSAGCGGAFL